MDNINQHITDAEELTAAFLGLNAYAGRINTVRTAIITQLRSLATNLNALASVYNKIGNIEGIDNSTLDLRTVYKTIYSTKRVDNEEITKAVRVLRDTIVEYLMNADANSIENTSTFVQKMSACVTYLGEFERYKNLDDGLSRFERVNLSQIYIILPNTTDEPGEAEAPPTTTLSAATTLTGADEDDPTADSEPELKEVSATEWNRLRKQDVATFPAFSPLNR